MSRRLCKVLVVIGTRPEAIKLAPVVWRLRKDRAFEVLLCLTAQHRELADKTLMTFGLQADIDLNLMREGQSPREVLRRLRRAMSGVLEAEKPDLVLVQGDTTTALGAALCAARRGVPVAHVEAGLRSFDRRNPRPEEGNRLRVDAVSKLLFAPTQGARANLLREGAEASRVFVTGNTVVDSLLWALKQPHRFEEPALRGLPRRALAVVTLHRRESFGSRLEAVLRGIRDAAELMPDFFWVCPVHPNPRVRGPVRRILSHPRIRLTGPLGYLDFVRLMRRASFILTDSGGIQEEAPSLGKPVLVVRDKTERPELLGRGGLLVGTSREKVVRAIRGFVAGRFPRLPKRNPFGDGLASERIARILRAWAGASPAPVS